MPPAEECELDRRTSARDFTRARRTLDAPLCLLRVHDLRYLLEWTSAKDCAQRTDWLSPDWRKCGKQADVAALNAAASGTDSCKARGKSTERQRFNFDRI